MSKIALFMKAAAIGLLCLGLPHGAWAQSASANDTARFLAGMEVPADSALAKFVREPDSFTLDFYLQHQGYDALKKAGAALRQLIGGERLVVVFAMLSERDPVQLLAALRTLQPDAAVFTEPASAAGHAVSPDDLAKTYGAGGQAVRPAAAALARARELAGSDGNVLVCGSMYLVGEILVLTA